MCNNVHCAVEQTRRASAALLLSVKGPVLAFPHSVGETRTAQRIRRPLGPAKLSRSGAGSESSPFDVLMGYGYASAYSVPNERQDGPKNGSGQPLDISVGAERSSSLQPPPASCSGTGDRLCSTIFRYTYEYGTLAWISMRVLG
ncbi:hypothetical protein LY76DRAFT_251163 [Colletotrichum caudatum]|nr:hypothetical protein LY76DRAFT_251163 [Colletotrichum caudatum]